MIDFKQKYLKKFKILTFKDTMHIFFDVSNVNLEVDSWAQFVSKLFKPLIYSNVPFLRIVLKCFDAIQRMLHLSKSNRYTFSVCNFREKYHSYYIFVGVWWFRVWGPIEYSKLYNHVYNVYNYLYCTFKNACFLSYENQYPTKSVSIPYHIKLSMYFKIIYFNELRNKVACHLRLNSL